MPPKIKSRPAGGQAPVSTVKPLMVHDVTSQTASAHAVRAMPVGILRGVDHQFTGKVDRMRNRNDGLPSPRTRT